MNKTLLISLLGLILFSSSCSPSLKITNSTAKTATINSTGIYHNPVVADLDVSDEKVEAEVISQTNNELLKDLKQKAVVKALKKLNADVLVEPKYQIVNVGSKKTVTVQGYPATYKNFRNASPADVDLLLVDDGNSIETQEVKDQEVRSGKVGVISVLAGVGAVVVLVLVL